MQANPQRDREPIKEIEMNTEIITAQQTATQMEEKHYDLADRRTIAEVVEMFIASQDVKESSRKSYKRALRQFALWVMDAKHYSFAELTRVQILEYKEELLASGKSSLTASSYLTSVRRFYEWLEASKIYPNIAKGVKTPYRKKQFRKQPLYPDQVKTMLDAEQHTNSLRDYALVNLLVRTGLRTIEASRANVEDITYKGGQLVLMVMGKGRDEIDDFVILTDKAYKPLKEYLDSRKAKGGQPLFTSESNNSKGERMTTRTINGIAKRALRAAGLDSKYYTAHSLRHTAAIGILLGGGTLEMVQMTLRHANPATTQIYTATINEKRRLAASGESLLDSMY